MAGYSVHKGTKPKSSKGVYIMSFRAFTGTILLLSGTALSSGALAQTAPEDATNSNFTLGEIIVTGSPQRENLDIGTTRIGSEAIYAFQRDSLDQAASLIPGVSMAASGNSRNERQIYVRGFNMFQAPLSIDGIRIYLPADGRLDYGRFLTPDISEIQVAKGYASVLDGPGAMGGAVNLVTRKPTKELEVEARGTINLDNDAGYAGYTTFASLGTKQDKWYAQASFARNFTDHWSLSNDFTPQRNEDGGERGFSRSADWRVNAKIGFTPNATDEYAISYTRQEGEKLAPLHISDTTGIRYWTWPYWNLQNIYFLSTTALSDTTTLKTRVYYNKFQNSLDSFDDAGLVRQTRMSAFNSAYDDEAFGGSVEIDAQVSSTNRTSVSFHIRSDKHREIQETFVPALVEPWQTNRELTYSAAIENSLTLSPTLRFVVGASYDARKLIQAEDFTDRAFVYYPLKDADAWNGQGQLIWSPDEQTNMHLSVSSRARFPTLFERFSTRFGGATSNPGLKAERATQVEVGGSRTFGIIHAEGAVWYARVTDAIMSVPFIIRDQASSRSENVGNGDYYGAEITLSAQVTPTLGLGGNYSFVKRDLRDPNIAAFRPVGVPTHKAFAYAQWQPLAGLNIVPNVDIASNRGGVNTAGTRYYRLGNYVLANLRVDYEVYQGVTVGVGGRNLFDENYMTADGYPEPGRTLFASLRVKY